MSNPITSIANIKQWPEARLVEHQDDDDKTSEAKFAEHWRRAKARKEEQERHRREDEKQRRAAEEAEALPQIIVIKASIKPSVSVRIRPSVVQGFRMQSGLFSFRLRKKVPLVVVVRRPKPSVRIRTIRVRIVFRSSVSVSGSSSDPFNHYLTSPSHPFQPHNFLVPLGRDHTRTHTISLFLWDSTPVIYFTARRKTEEAQRKTEEAQRKKEAEEAARKRAVEIKAQQSADKGKGRAPPQCTRCEFRGLECEVGPGKATSCLECREAKVKCERPGTEKSEKRRRRVDSEAGPSKKRKRTLEDTAELSDGGDEKDVKTLPQLGALLVDAIRGIQETLLQQNRRLDKQNELLGELVDLKMRKIFGEKEEEEDDSEEEAEELPEEELAELASEKEENAQRELAEVLAEGAEEHSEAEENTME
ncbi:hypothetical protein L210DRAFT_3648110 [Boletus edulis BED1]|uniref:Zn(2)-C6 fungal-type domain-containing protein n=1 Tax=Boletus edulis BED1 TaxID=1328754 RepID=A0AAD4BPD7_BOLED|nr:hypothetical protein L210DRAFT_3648110 [Boletus edulis BED1]